MAVARTGCDHHQNILSILKPKKSIARAPWSATNIRRIVSNSSSQRSDALPGAMPTRTLLRHVILLAEGLPDSEERWPFAGGSERGGNRIQQAHRSGDDQRLHLGAALAACAQASVTRASSNTGLGCGPELLTAFPFSA